MVGEFPFRNLYSRVVHTARERKSSSYRNARPGYAEVRIQVSVVAVGVAWAVAL